MRLANWIRSVWKRLVTSRYVEALEIEVTRLRLENQAMMNSILGIAGFPPVVTSESAIFSVDGGGAGARATVGPGVPASAAPVRRPSWHQVNKTLEFESAKRPEAISPKP